MTSQEGSELFQRVWSVVQEIEGPPCPVSWEGTSPQHNLETGHWMRVDRAQMLGIPTDLVACGLPLASPCAPLPHPHPSS